MNRIAKVLSQISDDMLMHYGVARRSGRYPWGSGDNPYQHSGDFLSRVQSLKKSGMSETDIAKTMGLTTTQLRTQMSLAKDERRAVQVATAKDLTTYDADTINLGCNVDMHYYKLKNVSWENGGGITGTMNFVQIDSMNSDGTAARWRSGHAYLKFERGVLIGAGWNDY